MVGFVRYLYKRSVRECKKYFDVCPEICLVTIQGLAVSAFFIYRYYQIRLSEDRYLVNLYRDSYVVYRPSYQNAKVVRPPADYPGAEVSHRSSSRWAWRTYVFDPQDLGEAD